MGYNYSTKQMKKLLKFLVAMVFATLLSANVFAYSFVVDGIYYNINSDGTTVSVTYQDTNYYSYSGSYSSNVTIPPTVTHNGTTYSVTSIGFAAFIYSTNLTSVTIPNSVTSIGPWAFYGCSNLNEITLPNSVTSIERSAFSYCTGLTSVTIPNSVTNIGRNAFDSCINLTNIDIPNSITIIDTYVFRYCTGLTSVTIPNSVTNIGMGAFFNCTGLTSVTIGNSVTSIGVGAFDYCTGLTSITIPNSVTSIGNSAFELCTGLTSVTIGNSVTSIEAYAFLDCTGLTSVTIPNNVTSIGIAAFRNCTGLTTLSYNADSCSFYPGFYGYYYHWLDGCNNLTTINIGNNVRYISDTTFANCTGLTTINYNAVDCNGNGFVGVADNYWLRGCDNITTVNIGDSVQTIPPYFMLQKSGLTSITIPRSVISIGGRAFDDCTGLTTLNYNADSCNTYKYNYGTWLGNSNNLTTVNIGNNVRFIPDYFISYEPLVSSVTIPNSVTSIGDDAFYDCTGLTSITIPNSVISIGDGAFMWCEGLTSATIGNSVTSINHYAFAYCTGLTSITIPNSVTSIGGRAFGGCTGLTTLNYNADSCTTLNMDDGSWLGNSNNINTVNIGNNVRLIPDYFISSMSLVSSVTIPNNVISIGKSAFRNCEGLTSINIPNSVTTIGESAFRGCTGLDIVTIGSGVTEIRDNAFDGCGSLDTIYSMPTIPPTIYSYTFNNVYRGIPLYVPCGTLEDYSSATYWREFSNIQEYCESGSVVVETREATDITDTTATLNGEITIAGNPEILAQGFEWKEQNASSYNVVNVSGTILTEVLTGLTPNTTYTYRAFATTPNGTQYGEDVVFTTLLNSGIDDIEKENTIAVYPNPAKENITLTADEDIFIYSNLGQIVKQVNNPKGEITINVSDLQKGVYYIKTGNRQQKLIINN